MKRYIFKLVLASTILSCVNPANAQVLEVQKPINNTKVNIVESGKIYLPSNSKGKPNLEFPLSKLALIKYDDNYLPGVVDLEYQDTLGQRIGIDKASPQVLSVWHKDVIYLTVNKPYSNSEYCSNGVCSYLFAKPTVVELTIGSNVFTLEEHEHNITDYYDAHIMFTTYRFSIEVKQALQDADPKRVKLRIKIADGEFVTTSIGEKTIKVWQTI